LPTVKCCKNLNFTTNIQLQWPTPNHVIDTDSNQCRFQLEKFSSRGRAKLPIFQPGEQKSTDARRFSIELTTTNRYTPRPTAVWHARIHTNSRTHKHTRVAYWRTNGVATSVPNMLRPLLCLFVNKNNCAVKQ